MAAVAFNDGVPLRCESALVGETKQGHPLLPPLPHTHTQVLGCNRGQRRREEEKKRGED